MHNKLLLVAGSFAIAGGRNIADAYFERVGEPDHFIDMDVLMAGPAMRELGAVFDRFWNSPQAWTHAEVVASGAVTRTEAGPTERMQAPAVDDQAPAPAEALAAQLARRHVELEPGEVEVLADAAEAPAPQVSTQDAGEPLPQSAVMRADLKLLRSAHKHLLMVSPYAGQLYGATNSDRRGVEWTSERDGRVRRSSTEAGGPGWTERLLWTMLGLLVADDYL